MTQPPGLILRTARPDDLARLDGLFGRSYPRLLKADYPPSVLVTALTLGPSPRCWPRAASMWWRKRVR